MVSYANPSQTKIKCRSSQKSILSKSQMKHLLYPPPAHAEWCSPFNGGNVLKHLGSGSKVPHSWTSQAPGPLLLAYAQKLTSHLAWHGSFCPALKCTSPHPLNLLALHSQLPLGQLAFPQWHTLLCVCLSAGSDLLYRAWDIALSSYAMSIYGRWGMGGDEGFEIYAVCNQGLNAAGELRGASEEVGPVRRTPKWIRRKGRAQGGKYVGERR